MQKCWALWKSPDPSQQRQTFHGNSNIYILIANPFLATTRITVVFSLWHLYPRQKGCFPSNLFPHWVRKAVPGNIPFAYFSAPLLQWSVSEVLLPIFTHPGFAVMKMQYLCNRKHKTAQASELLAANKSLSWFICLLPKGKHAVFQVMDVSSWTVLWKVLFLMVRIK